MAIAWLGKQSRDMNKLKELRDKILLQMKKNSLIDNEAYENQSKKPAIQVY